MRYIFSIVLCISVLVADAMNGQFMHLTTNNGLAHNHVNCILEDSDGVMWFGTRNGVCRYDGYSMDTYAQSRSNINELPNNFIRAIFQDKEGNIWIGTDKGAARYCKENDKFIICEGLIGHVTSFAENANGIIFCASSGTLYQLIGENRFTPVIYGINQQQIIPVNVLAVDQNDNLWIGARNGLTSYNASFTTSNHYTIPRNNGETLEDDLILDLFIDNANNVWASRNGGGIICLNQKDMSIKSYLMSDGLVNNIVRAISQDDNGRIWCGTEGGISILSPDGKFDNICQEFSNLFSLNDNAIYDICRDKNGNMWIGTYFGGVNIFLKEYENVVYYIAGNQFNQLKGKAVRQMVEQDPGILWIATEDGGLNRLNQNTGKIDRVDLPCMKSNNVHSLAIIKNELWIGTFMDGLICYNLNTHKIVNYNSSNSNLPNNSVFELYYDGDKLWIGTARGLCSINPSTCRIDRVDADILGHKFVYYITGDSCGNLWCGMRNDGLFRYNKATGMHKCWTAQVGENNLSDDYVTVVYSDSKNDIYVGTNNGGLYRYNKDTDNFYSFIDAGVLTEPCICGLIEDGNGNIWITTTHGLYMLNRERCEVSKIRVSNVMSINHFNYTSTYRNSQGKLFFGSVNGIVSFFPNDLCHNVVYPKVIVRSVTLGNNQVIPTSSNTPITISHEDANLITIEYVGINAAASSTIKYAIKMDGLYRHWTEIGNQRKIVFSHLKPGKYTFFVRATSETGHWSDDNITKLDIEVSPPYYATWWAYLLYFTVFSCIVLAFIQYVKRILQKKQMVDNERLKKEQENALISMKADFFANISHEFRTPLSLIIAPVQQMLHSRTIPLDIRKNLKLILRNSNSLMTIVNDIIAFNKSEMLQEIKLRKGNPFSYISDLAMRFEPLAQKENIEYKQDIEDWDEDVYYSRTVVKIVINNLLSNAFKYTAANGKVSLSAQYVRVNGGRLLEIVVADTGCGIAANNLNKIFDKYYQIETVDNQQHGWGIGLALVRNLVILHKGTIHVDSELGKGSVFTVHLDVSPDAFSSDRLISEESDNEKQTTPLLNIASQMTTDNSVTNSVVHADNNIVTNEILIVEDNPDMLQFLESLFISNSYKVITADCGEKALDALSGDKLPDIIISDVMMPGIDGTELCHRIKSNILTVHIPVVLLTAKIGHQHSLKGYECGADAYIEKPFDPSGLLLQVRNIIRMRDINRAKFRESKTPDIEIMANNKYDRKLLKDIKEIVEENIGNSDFCVNDILSAVGLSRTMLHIKLKSLLNMSIGDYIIEMRIAKAKELLRCGESISDTAYAAGFSEPSYFSKCFKKKTGITPSEFIKSEQ